MLYPLTATLAKVQDRMAPDAPPSLDGMTYMQYATHADEGVDMDLSQDYNAIRWMQENVVGSPVIVEAHLPNIVGVHVTPFIPGFPAWLVGIGISGSSAPCFRITGSGIASMLSQNFMRPPTRALA